MIGLLTGIGFFLLLIILPPPEGLALPAWRVAAVAALLATFWLTEAIPLAVTSLLPIVLFPMLGVASVEVATAPYANPIVFLFLGGFVLALAIERWNLHRRIALTVLSKVGSQENLQIAGFMLATGLLSMWVSNTATVALMLPVALSVVPRDANGRVAPGKENFATALMLGIAYGASSAGISTLIGTPPNAFLAGFMRDTYDIEIGFAQWMLFGVPISCLMGFLSWILLTRWLHPVGRTHVPGASAKIKDQLQALGAASAAEKRVAVVFATTALLWIARPVLMSAWPWLQLSDTTIAIMAAVVLFVIPNGQQEGHFLLDWPYAERLPWGVLLLFGGGLSLAAAVANTGLAAWIGNELADLYTWPILLLIMAVAVLIIFLTELTSNIATAATFLPIVAALSVSLDQSPLMLAIPAALASSFAFMLPVATPPNAIVFASGHISIQQMVKAGFWLNLIGIGVITLAVTLLLGPVFGL